MPTIKNIPGKVSNNNNIMNCSLRNAYIFYRVFACRANGRRKILVMRKPIQYIYMTPLAPRAVVCVCAWVWRPLCIYCNWISWAFTAHIWLGAYSACQLIVNHVSSRIRLRLLLLLLLLLFVVCLLTLSMENIHTHTHTHTRLLSEEFSRYTGNLLARVWTATTKTTTTAEHVWPLAGEK